MNDRCWVMNKMLFRNSVEGVFYYGYFRFASAMIFLNIIAWHGFDRIHFRFWTNIL